MDEYKIIYPQKYEIIDLLRPFVGGAKKYCRILIKPTIKEEDRDTEVVDEENKTIYRVPSWMVPQLVERLEYEYMTKDWVKTKTFIGEEEDYLRFLSLALGLQGQKENDSKSIEVSELLNNQRLEKKQPVAYTYKELVDMAEPLLKDVYRDFFKRKYRWLCKLRNEILPNFI